MTNLSRTVGQDQVVDEIAINFTHTQQIDWLLPAFPPLESTLKWPSW
jgi:carboxymethylenebutenolidase